MKNQFEDLKKAEFHNGFWYLNMPNRAGVSIALKEKFRTDLCARVYEMYPKAPKAHIASLVGCSGATVSYKISQIDRLKKKRVVENKPSPVATPVDATPEEDEAFNSLANQTQVAGNHYQSKAIQPWDFIASNNMGYLEGNIIKYVSRWKDKGGVDDLKKAQHYLQKLIEVNQ